MITPSPTANAQDVTATHTPGPWVVCPFTAHVLSQGFGKDGELLPIAAMLWPTDERSEAETQVNARLIAAAPDLITALTELADVFAHDGENSVARFDRLAAMFRKDTGYTAPGKDSAAGPVSQADRDGLNAIYDAWYIAKVTRARAAIAKATAA